MQICSTLILVTMINTDVTRISLYIFVFIWISLFPLLIWISLFPLIMRANICNSYFLAETIYFHITGSIN